MTTPTSERMAELIERRDFLLRSIDDLEREHDAGDLAAADFDLLHRDYSSRAAQVLRELEGIDTAARTTRAATPIVRAIARKSRLLKGCATVGIVLFALASGFFVANIAGVRAGNQGLTGSVNAAKANTTDAQVQALLRLGRESLNTDPLKAIRSFDQAVALDPSQVEAMTYAGWVLRLVARSVEDQAKHKELLDGAMARINRAIATNPQYPDAHAFRGIILLRDLDDAKASLQDFALLDSMTVPPEVSALIGNARTDAEAAVNDRNSSSTSTP